MSDRVEVRLAGTGGQGLNLAGIMLADAAIRDRKHAVQTQSYGPEARGGASSSDVIIADEEIDYPGIVEADILLCMSQQACDRYYSSLKRGGLLVVDAAHVERTPTSRAIRADLTAWALEATGREITASVVALGFVVGLTDVVSRRALRDAVRARAPSGTGATNAQALDRGLAEAERLREQL